MTLPPESRDRPLKRQRAPRSQRGMTVLGLTLATAAAALLVILKVLAQRR